MCSFSVTKYLLFFFNFVFWILGLILVGIGLWAYFDDEFTDTMLKYGLKDEDEVRNLMVYIHYMAFFVIALGAVITIIGFFGCCGAVRQSKCCLGTFFTLLLICFLATVLFGGFLMFVAATADSEDSFSKDVRDAFRSAIKLIWESLTEDQRHDFEKANNCCGMDNSFNVLVKNFQCSITQGVPGSCYEKLVDNVKAKFWIAGGVMLAIAVIEVIGMAMACTIYNAVPALDNRYVYRSV